MALALTVLAVGPARADAGEVVCTNLTTTVSSTDGGPANLQLAGTLCRPNWGVPRAVQVLVHGATYNRIVWDWPQNPDLYSYVRAAARFGYATFSVDRIGHGASARPPSASVTISAGATALHGVVTKLRAGSLGGTAFSRVIWAGHSLGAVLAYEYGGRYSDIDAYLLTGSIHFMRPSWLAQIQSNVQPTGSDSGYLTTAPGTRGSLFYHLPTADPAVIAHDEATKDTVTAAEIQTGLPLVNTSPAQSPTRFVTVPVLVAIGQHDNVACGGSDGMTCTVITVTNLERPYFPSASQFTALVIANTGHALSQHTTAASTNGTLLAWATTVVPPQ